MSRSHIWDHNILLHPIHKISGLYVAKRDKRLMLSASGQIATSHIFCIASEQLFS